MDRSIEIYDSNGELSSRVLRDVIWSTLRQARDDALKDSDWRAGKDVVLSTAWKEYRSFLRDLPQNFDSANDAADAWAAYDIPE